MLKRAFIRAFEGRNKLKDIDGIARSVIYAYRYYAYMPEHASSKSLKPTNNPN